MVKGLVMQDHNKIHIQKMIAWIGALSFSVMLWGIIIEFISYILFL